METMGPRLSTAMRHTSMLNSITETMNCDLGKAIRRQGLMVVLRLVWWCQCIMVGVKVEGVGGGGWVSAWWWKVAAGEKKDVEGRVGCYSDESVCREEYVRERE